MHPCVRLEPEHRFGANSVLNETIWVEHTGKSSKIAGPNNTKHCSGLRKHQRSVHFNFENMERIPAMAPVWSAEEKAARGKTPTDVWWHSRISKGEILNTHPPAFGKDYFGSMQEKMLVFVHSASALQQFKSRWKMSPIRTLHSYLEHADGSQRENMCLGIRKKIAQKIWTSRASSWLASKLHPTNPSGNNTSAR